MIIGIFMIWSFLLQRRLLKIQMTASIWAFECTFKCFHILVIHHFRFFIGDWNQIYLSLSTLVQIFCEVVWFSLVKLLESFKKIPSKIIFGKSFLSINFKICLPLLLLVKKSEGCLWNFPYCMLYSILHILLTFEKFPSCTLYSICTIIW